MLSSEGELLAITLRDTGDLLLAVPTEQLKSMFPKALGQEEAASETTSVLNQRAPEEIAERLKSLQGTWTIDYFSAPDGEQSETPPFGSEAMSFSWCGLSHQMAQGNNPRKSKGCKST